jgi:hypothetical protein
MQGGFFQTLARHGAIIFAASLQLALPLIVTMLVVNLSLGVLTRAAPQLHLRGRLPRHARHRLCRTGADVAVLRTGISAVAGSGIPVRGWTGRLSRDARGRPDRMSIAS